jgi:chemotaxis protein CheX
MSSPLKHEDLVAIVRTATLEVFSTMLGLELVQKDAYLNPNPNQPSTSDGVVSFVGLAGNWVGTGNISCSAVFACKVSAALLATEYTAVNEDVLDAVAEVTNMIIGNVKTNLEEQLGPIGLSIPTVVYGRNFTSRSVGTQEWTVVPFACEGEAFSVQIFLMPQPSAGRSKVLSHSSAIAV